MAGHAGDVWGGGMRRAMKPHLVDFALMGSWEKEWFGGEGWFCVCWVLDEFDCILKR